MSNSPRQTMDKVFNRLIFQFLPARISPDFFTALRIAFIPLVLWLLALQLFGWALVAFVIAAVFDVLDGSLYRIRKRSSGWGIILDPSADKLLVILTCLFLSFYYPYAVILVLSIIADLMIIAAGFLMLIVFKNFQLPHADVFGKVKMLCESVGVAFVLGYLIFGSFWLWPSFIVMFAALLLGFASFLAYGINFARGK